MHIESLEIPDVWLVIPTKHDDARGYFSETFRADSFGSRGVNVVFNQENHVRSTRKGVVRGLHYQTPPHAQGKLVRCNKGAILDVAVDIRIGSPSYGLHVAVELSEHNWRQLWVPSGFAHGYITLESDCEVIYKVTDYYAPQCERGIAWDDPSLGIDWRIPAHDIILSDKDRNQPLLADSVPEFQFGS